jgi:hypothetical protein
VPIPRNPGLTAIRTEPTVCAGHFPLADPLDVLTRLVPRLLARGEDPFSHDFPITGYPEVSLPQTTDGRQLSDEFLEDIAREYLQLGRGYIRKMAQSHHVSERTIASWVHKARERGILTATRRGARGGQWVEREARQGAGGGRE